MRLVQEWKTTLFKWFFLVFKDRSEPSNQGVDGAKDPQTDPIIK